MAQRVPTPMVLTSLLFHLDMCELRASLRSNRTKFVELPLDELELKYDPEWLQEKVVACWNLMYSCFSFGVSCMFYVDLCIHPY